jgi:DNA polymerase beta
MDFKPKILDALEKLRQKELANKEPFKVRAYANVIKSLNAYENPINKIEDIKDIKGVGTKIYDKIKEIIDTGELKQLEKYTVDIEAINELTKVHGIGPTKANDLVKENGITTIEELKKHPELLNAVQKIGLKYVDDFQKRIPRAEMEKHATFILEIIKKLDPKLTAEVVGSYRRGAKDSGDIDVIISHDDNPENYDHIIKQIVDHMKKESYLTDDLAQGTHKYLGVCRLKRHRTSRRIDLLYATKNVWPFSLIYFTGSLDMNVVLRRVALDKGLSLSEYGFKKVGSDALIKLPLYTEEDVFKYLGFKYIPANERTGNQAMITKYTI